MKKILFFAMTFSLAISCAYAQKTKEMPIVADKDFIIGKLDNGLTYYIRRNTVAAGNADFYIVHNVGSLQEDENQRGLAHFLEHMAFNGTKNFPGKNMRDDLAKVGVRFGDNLNAYTSQDRTVYNISSVPVGRETLVDSVILMLHDWSSFISCEPKEIDEERGVIHEEWRRRDDVKTRMMKTVFDMDYAGSRFAQRDPIGLMSVVDNFEPKALTDYYHKWYRPDLQAVVVAGDIDPKKVEASIKRIFSDIPKVKNGARKEYYKVDYVGKNQVGYFHDPETRAIACKLDIRFPNDDVKYNKSNKYMEQTLLREVISAAMGNRASQEIKQPGAATKRCVMIFSRIYYDCNIIRFTSVPVEKNYRKCMVALFDDAEQMLRYGFTQDEFEDAVAIVKGRYTKSVKSFYEPSNQFFADLATQNFTREFPLADPKKYIDCCIKMIDEMTAADINEYIKKNIKFNNSVAIFVGPENMKSLFPSEKDVNFIRDSVRKADVKPFDYKATGKFVFSKKLVPVKIISKEKYAAVDSCTVFTLPGGTKVYWRETKPDMENRVIMKAYKQGGYAIEDEKDIKNARLSSSAASTIAFAGLCNDDIVKITSAKNMNITESSSSREDAISGSFKVSDAETFFQMMYERHTQPQADKKALDIMLKSTLQGLKMKKGEMRKFQDSLRKETYEPTPLMQEVKAEDVESYTPDRMMSYFKQHFCDRKGMNFIFSGPMSAEAAKPFIEKYIGNIASVTEYPKSDKGFYMKKGTRTFTYNAKNVKSSVCDVTIDAVAFGKFDLKQIDALRFLCGALRDRYIDILREKMGGTYSVSVSPAYQVNPEGYACVSVYFTADGKNLEALDNAVYEGFAAAEKDGVSQESMDSFKKFLIKSAKQRDYSKINWNSRIYDSLENEGYMDFNDIKAIESVTREDVHEIAKTIFGQKNVFTQIYKPIINQ